MNCPECEGFIQGDYYELCEAHFEKLISEMEKYYDQNTIDNFVAIELCPLRGEPTVSENR